MAAVEKDIEAQIADAVEFALASPFPDAEELKRDVLNEEVVP